MSMEKVVNKWNGREYTVVNKNDKLVTLRRGDGSEFQIAWREFKEAYREQNSDN